MPTILSAVGIDAPQNLPGLDLLPLCKNGKEISRDALFGEIYSHDVADLDDPSKSLLYEWCIKGKQKLIQTFPGKLGPYKTIHSVVPQGSLYFDLANDPLEENLLKKGPSVLQESLKKWRESLE